VHKKTVSSGRTVAWMTVSVCLAWCGGVVNNQIMTGLFLSLSVIFCFKSVNISQSYEQERCCLVHFVRLATTLLKDEESTRDNHVLACNFVKIHRF